MVDTKQRTTLKKLARWTPSTTTSRNQFVQPLSQEAPFTIVPHDKLQQGGLYILKIKQVSLALFEGWDDDMCCFSILRSEVEPLRWSEARQLPGDFDIYDAFDECGNPPIHLWSRYLRVSVPINWFAMFEEAKRRQRDWAIQQHHIRRSLVVQNNNSNDFYYNNSLPPPPQQQQTEDVAFNQQQSVYSNTDVSSMQLNRPSITSLVASTNIVDPSLMLNEQHSHHGDTSKSSSSIKHHRSKEEYYVTPLNETNNNDVTPSSSLPNTPLITPPDLNNDVRLNSNFSSELDFPHDSDRFSIRSDIVSNTVVEEEKKSPRDNRRQSVKRMIFGQ